jgi:hypothetical protein
MVPVELGPNLVLGEPQFLFEGRYSSLASPFGRTWDLSPDGERFLMAKEAEDPEQPTEIVVVLNWFEELRRRVPLG